MKKLKGNFSFTCFLVLVGILFYLVSPTVSGAIPPEERAALIALYDSTTGDYWYNKDGWRTPPLDVDGFALPGTENTWSGIICDPGNTTVIEISKGSNNLDGPLPPELGNLASLQTLSLDSNQLSGSIPKELGNLANLQYLSLYLNQISGSIPPELGNLTNLRYLSLYSTQLSGSIPPELGNLASLQYLYLYDNQLSDTIPPELGNLTNLSSLRLDSNQLSGSIPPELGNLASLQYLYLYDNQLSGTIPPELANLTNLDYLYLNNNQLSDIPPELGNMVYLINLNLSGNRFSGSLPPELGNMVSLRTLRVSSNQFSGSIPFNLTNLPNLNVRGLDIRWNALYTDDEYVRDFLSAKHDGPWESTQTIAPLDVNPTVSSGSEIDIDWTPIIYTAGTGGYRVFYSSIPGGPYTYFDITADKIESSIRVDNLDPVTTYYFVVQSRTNPHADNQNTVDSEYSFEISAETLQTCAISGRVTYDGSGLADVTIDLSNNGETATTDANGDYIATVDYGWSGTAAPVKTGYTFSPVDTNYPNVTANQTNQDYTASLQTFTITGTVIVTGSGSGLQGVVITLTNGGGTATTDANGNYSAAVDYGWSGTAKPSKAGYAFSPAKKSYTNVTANQTNQDYTASSQTVTISGIVTRAGRGLQDVTITLSNNGGTADTDENGNYSLQVNSGWSGTATPSKPNCTFSPTSFSYTNITTDQANQDFSVDLPSVTISGAVTGSGSGVPGITIKFSNGVDSVITDASGNYSLTVPGGWTGTATPFKEGYKFSPPTRGYTDILDNQTNRDYTVEKFPAITISGTITSNGTGAGVKDVTVVFSNGGGTAVTDAQGNYSAPVESGWSGTATPSKPGYTFSPLNIGYSNVTTDQTNEDYTATLNKVTISGIITSDGIGLPGVIISQPNGRTETTLADGTYSVEVNYGWSGTFTPSKPGYDFTPDFRPYDNITVDQPNENYTAPLHNVTISGTVTDGGGPLADVTLTPSSGADPVLTQTDGTYSLTVNYGWTGEVIPSKAGYNFTPGKRIYNSIVTVQTGQNYQVPYEPVKISGRVILGDGTGLAGVTIIPSSGDGSAATADDGSYTLTVDYGWSGTVTPSNTGYNFDPPERVYSNVTADMTGQDYTANPSGVTISGTVTSGVNRLNNVTVTLTNDGGIATTDADGNYSVTVSYGWTGTATPSKTGYNFTEPYIDYTNVTADQPGQDYTAVLKPIEISGKVTDAGIGLEGVTVSLTNGRSMITGADGSYLFIVNYGWSGTVTPSKEGYTFSPGYMDYVGITVDHTKQDYAATPSQ